MTTNQITSLARAKLLEQTSDIITDATILIYANLAYQDIIKRAFPNDQIGSATITFTNGVGTLPTNFGTLYGDAKLNDSSFFPEISIEDFNKRTLSQSVTIEGGQMKVYPTSTSSLSVKYYKSYIDLTSAENPSINSYFHELIVYGILARAHEDLQDESLAKLYTDKYETELAKKIAVISQYEETNQRSAELFAGMDIIGDEGSGFKGTPNFFP